MSFRWFGWFRKPVVKAYDLEEVVVATCAPQCCGAEAQEAYDLEPLEDGDALIFEELETLDPFFEPNFSDEVAGALEGDLCAWKEAAEEAGSTEPSDFEPDEDWKEANARANEEASEASSLEAIVAEAVAAYSDQKVAAIKHVRNITGLRLQEAKDAVDEVWHEPVMQTKMRNHVS
jgi:ribosomal protein L7/L12